MITWLQWTGTAVTTARTMKTRCDDCMVKMFLLVDGVHCRTTGHGLMQLLARVLVYMQILRHLKGVAVGEAVFVCGEAKIFASLRVMWS